MKRGKGDSCANCALFVADEHAPVTSGLCKRYPPLASMEPMLRWPRLPATEWCGEWDAAWPTAG